MRCDHHVGGQTASWLVIDFLPMDDVFPLRIIFPYTGVAGHGKLPTATLSVSEGFVEIVDLAELEVYHPK